MTQGDAWADGENYERYMGRWSRKIAREYVAWLGQAPGLSWLDVGCGTGALTGLVLEVCEPREVVAVDPAEAFVAYARSRLADSRSRFEVGGAEALPLADGSMDVVVSALAYNFFPDRPGALAEMRRVVKPGGAVSLYVWDYPGGGMGFMDAFWQAAIDVDPAAETAGERSRFPFCTADGLASEAEAAGLSGVDVRPIEVVAEFVDFDDLWQPFTKGTGPAPAFFQRLEPGKQAALRGRLAAVAGDGPIAFPARAWAMKGRSGS